MQQTPVGIEQDGEVPLTSWRHVHEDPSLSVEHVTFEQEQKPAEGHAVAAQHEDAPAKSV